MRFTPKGLADAFDATDAFPGACLNLGNVIFDTSNPELTVPRPGVTELYQLTTLGFANAGFVSVFGVSGSRIFGMVASSRNPGQDEPFCIDIATGAAVAIAGVTAANTPLSPASSGEWIPPTLSSIGVYIIVTHPGFNGVGANFFGVINLTNPAAPVWSSANCATNPLTAVPSAVANLNNRAWFAVGNQLQYTDSLDPLTRTNATMALVVGDTGVVNALSGLPMTTTSSGVLAVLTAFKLTQVWQVSGDPTTSDLALNFISLKVGTNAPRSVSQSPAGLYFLSTGSPYFIDPFGVLRPLSHRADRIESDVQTPFINATTPSRWAGAYNSAVVRFCGPTVLLSQAQTCDYWFDERRRRWNGPHTFQYDCADAYDSYFILSSVNNPGSLMRSQPSAKTDTIYTDMLAAYDFTVGSAAFPKVGDMCMKQVSESQIELGGYPSGVVYTITASDEAGEVIDTVQINVASAAVSPIWGGGGSWGGGGIWGAASRRPPLTYAVPWHAPLVFEKLLITVTADVNRDVEVGTFFARYQKTGYMTTR